MPVRKFALTVVLACLMTFFMVPASYGEEINPTYSAGLKSYQDSNFQQAKQDFGAALQEEPDNPLINYNLALTEWKLGNAGMSLALLRRAQYEDPAFRPAIHAEKFVKESLKVKDLPHQISAWEALRQQVLKPVSLDGFLIATALLLFVVGVSLSKYLGARRRSLEEGDSVTPPSPMISAVSVVLLIAVLSATVMKFFDLSIQRGTIVAPKVEALTGPDSSASVLFELFEGLEVIVRRTFVDSNQKEWAQVTYPGGMTGWIPSENLISHSEWKSRQL